MEPDTSRIVIATANADLFNVFALELQGSAYEVQWELTGKDALDAVTAATPAGVLLDESLPIFNGIETCGFLRSDPSVPAELPIVLLTSEPLSPQVFDESGATAQFSKTHSVQELRELLATWIPPGHQP